MCRIIGTSQKGETKTTSRNRQVSVTSEKEKKTTTKNFSTTQFIISNESSEHPFHILGGGIGDPEKLERKKQPANNHQPASFTRSTTSPQSSLTLYYQPSTPNQNQSIRSFFFFYFFLFFRTQTRAATRSPEMNNHDSNHSASSSSSSSSTSSTASTTTTANNTARTLQDNREQVSTVTIENLVDAGILKIGDELQLKGRSCHVGRANTVFSGGVIYDSVHKWAKETM